MIEDFLARSGIGRCSEFRDTAEAVSKVVTRESRTINTVCADWLTC